MTTLQITPNWKNKTAKFKGTIAAGEHVAVSIANDDNYITDTTNLRLRVVNPTNGKTLAQFPMPEILPTVALEGEEETEGTGETEATTDEWDSDLTPLSCTINLNTDKMLMAVPPAANVPLLFVLDDYEGKTLYFKDTCEVTHWPRRTGEEEPTNLDDYKDIIEDFRERIDAAEDSISQAVDTASGIVAQATEARTTAQTAASNSANSALRATNARNAAQNAQAAAETAQGKAETAQGKAETAQGKAEDAQAAAETAQAAAEAALPLDTTLSNSGKAADAKAVGDALTLKANASTTYSKTEVDNAIAQEAQLRASGDQSLANDISALGTNKANKTDLADFFDGAEYDSNLKRIYFKHGQNRIDYIDATVFIKDGMVSSVAIIKVPDDEEPAGVADGNYLKVMFNTDAGRDPIYILLTDIFNPANYYDKVAVDNLLDEKQDALTFDNAPTSGSNNPVKSGGVWSMLWGALAALPTGFSSLYDWVVDQLAGKASKADVDPLLFAQYYPDGVVKSAAEFTPGIKYDAPDTTNRTITVKPFCNTGNSANDNSNLSGRVVIPPFVDAGGNPYISDDGTRYKVVGVSGGSVINVNDDLTAIIMPNTVTSIGGSVFAICTSLASVSLPAATSIGSNAFYDCTSLTTVSLPAATSIGVGAFDGRTALTSVSLPAATSIGEAAFAACTLLASISLPAATSIGVGAFDGCTALMSVDFGDTPRSSVPSLGEDAFYNVPTSCKIIVPYSQYDAWIAASGWSSLPQTFVRHAEKADKPATFTAGNLAEFDSQGNPTDSGVKPSDKLDSTSAAAAFSTSPASLYGEGDYCTRNGKLYICKDPTTGGMWVPAAWDAVELVKPPRLIAPGNLASFANNTSLADSGIAVSNIALKDNIPYTLGTPMVIDSASSETVEGETVYYGAATLANRTANIVQVTAATALDELRITFPAATSGKVRDFGLRVEIGTGSAALTAPSLVPIAPTGETIKLENADGTIPELADGTATAKGVTLLYFSETAPGVFVVKGEQVEEVA